MVAPTAIGSTMPSIAAVRLMGTGRQQTSMAARRAVTPWGRGKRPPGRDRLGKELANSEPASSEAEEIARAGKAGIAEVQVEQVEAVTASAIARSQTGAWVPATAAHS